MRTVKSLLAAIRNFELSNSVRDQITEERRHNTNWQKDLNSSTAKTSAQEKSVSFPFTDKARTDTERSVDNDSLQHRNPSEIRDGDVPRCTNHPSSKTHWTWECKGGKKPAFTPKIKDKSNTPAYWRA